MTIFLKIKGTKLECSQVIAPIKNEAGEVCMYILNFEDTEAAAEPPNSADLASTVRFSKCNHSFHRSLSVPL